MIELMFRCTRCVVLVVFAIIVGVAGCKGKPTPNGGSGKTPKEEQVLDPDQPLRSESSHQRMVRELAQIAQRTEHEHLYIGDLAARDYQRRLDTLPPNAPVFQRMVLLSELGQEELNCDQLENGIGHLEEAVKLFEQVHHPDRAMREQIQNRLVFVLGTAYMRLGETQNCCLHFSGQSCIVPIQGAGIHVNREGSEKAIRCFLDVLGRSTDVKMEQVKVHEPARWLLNIAYMTLGEYPDGVPKEHLIPPSFFRSEVDFPRFHNIYPDLGLSTFNLSGGAIIDDFDGDDDLDILTSSYDSSSQTQLFRNDEGAFVEVTEEAGLKGFYGGLTMVQADYDNDGDVDVFIPRGAWLKAWGRHPNSLLRNDGGKFTDVTFDVGLGDVHYPTKTAAWADYDNDGDLDLYVGNETTPGEVDAPAQLFRNDDGIFTDVAAEAGVQENLFAMGAVWGDFNDDRYPDLFVSNGGDNRLYQNNQDGTFTDVAEKVGVNNPQASFPTWFWDYNNDGVLDLYIGCSSGHVGIQALRLRGEDITQLSVPLRQLNEEVKVEQAALYQGDGQGGFTNVATQQGLTFPTLPMGANYGDLNNDGRLDFYLGTGDVPYSELMPNLMYLNQNDAAKGTHGFADVTMAGGFGHLQKGHSVAFADLDNDGDQDVYMQMGGAYRCDKFNDALYENPGFGNHWLNIKLRGVTSNRCGIGARIHAEFTEQGETRHVYQWVTSGGSFGANPLRQSIGLGQATVLNKLEIYWPTSDSTQTFEDVAVDRTLEITEGSHEPREVTLTPYRFSHAGE